MLIKTLKKFLFAPLGRITLIANSSLLCLFCNILLEINNHMHEILFTDAYRSPAPVMRMSGICHMEICYLPFDYSIYSYECQLYAAFVDVSPDEILQKESTKASAENFYSEKELIKMLMIILLHQILIYTSVGKILFHGS